LSLTNLFEKHGEMANYADVIDFSMRESAFTVDSLIEEKYKAGVLLMDQDHLLEVVL